MTDNTENLRVSGLNTHGATAFNIQPTVKKRAAIAKQLYLTELRKLRFVGKITPTGNADWNLTGDLGATVLQPCVVTLAPVVSRIDIKVSRRFIAAPSQYGANQSDDTDEEIEIPSGDEIESLGSHINLLAVLTEALSLAMPLYPKAEGANLETTTFTEDGKTPMSDEAARPFAALSALRDKLENDTD